MNQVSTEVLTTGAVNLSENTPPAVKTMQVFKKQIYIKVQGKNFIAPVTLFLFIKDSSVMLVSKNLQIQNQFRR